MSFADNFSRSLRRLGIPATIGLISALGAVFVLAWLTHSNAFVLNLAFAENWAKPWTALTYPFASIGDGGEFVWVLLELYWLWWVGGEIERRLGVTRYLLFFAASTALGAFSAYLGLMVTRHALLLYSPLIPVSAVTVAWAVLNPRGQVRMWGIIPIEGRWIGWITVGIVLFRFGTGAPLLGVFACIPLAIAYAYASNRIPGLEFRSSSGPSYRQRKAAAERERANDDEVRRRKQEREEREQLRKLFERSIDDKS